MKNNTKVRLHLSKTLFENIVKEILTESKKMNMSGGAYTEAVKMPKKAKKVEEVNAVADTDKMKKMEEVDAVRDTESMRRMHEMSSKEKMAKGLYKEDEMGSSDKYPVGTVLFKPKGNQTITVKRVEGDKIFVVSDLTPNREFQWSANVIDDGIRTKEFQLKSSDQNEMQINVAEESPMNEFTGTETESSGAIAMIAAALGIGIPLAAALIKDLMRAKSPEEKKQIIQKELPGQGGDVAPKEAFGPQNESKKKVMPKLNELRKQIKNK